MAKLCIIASSKSWNIKLPDSLSEETGYKFELISDPASITLKHLAKMAPRYIFFPHWSHRIPVDVCQSFECIIFHMTDLPFGRGGSPLQNLITRGIYQTQISALKCEETMDAGPIYLKQPLSLYGAAEEIYLRASEVIKKMIVDIIKLSLQPAMQVGEPVTFERRKPEQGDLANAETLQQIFDLIRMLDAEGYPHAFINIGNLRFEFTRASRKNASVVADVRITLQDQNSGRTK